MSKVRLAIHGGDKAVQKEPGDLFDWPIITKEHEEAVLDVLRRRAMSGTDITKEFEKEFAAWQGTEYALGHVNGTEALRAAMFGCKVGVGDEIIAPSVTYWASALVAFSLGATVVFAEVEPDSLCIDPADIEHRITDRTKAIVVVHYSGHPTDMDSIMEIARRHNVKVIEDVSHAQGALYKGRKVGVIGDVGAMSLMSGKSFAIGEAGILVTDDREIFERAIAFGHYSRFNENAIQTDYLKPHSGLPMGGHKNRMHQMSAAVGRVQLKVYDDQIAEISEAMNTFWDLLEGVPGLQAHRPPKGSNSTMGGWYNAKGIYNKEELDGLSITKFTEAVRAEGVPTRAGVNHTLHLHPVFTECDIYGHGKPTRLANATRDVSQSPGSLPVSEAVGKRVYRVPWFKRYRRDQVEQYAAAFRKVAENYEVLLREDQGDYGEIGAWQGA